MQLSTPTYEDTGFPALILERIVAGLAVFLDNTGIVIRSSYVRSLSFPPDAVITVYSQSIL